MIQSHGGLHGGDVDLDYVAAGAFTYDHATGLGTNPPFGYNNRTISNTNGVVESLESGDFACDDLVTFFTQVVIDDGADGSGTVELDYSFGNETTGQPGLGFVDIISAAINTPDGGNVGNVADNVVTLSNEFIETQGYNELHGTVTITNLEPGETAIVRVIVELGCFPGSPTGNILTQIDSARADGDTASVGQQTVPMKVTGFVAEPSIDIEKFCPETAVEGEQITYEITIINDGNDDLENLIVTDTVDGHASASVPGAPTELAAGDSVQLEFTYTVQAGDPDPLPNTVTVEADGVFSETTVTDTDQCSTDLEQNPAIDVTKDCPEFGQVGDTITYTITVENTGDETLEDVTVEDTLLGDLSGSFADTFAPGDIESHDFPYEVQAGDDDPLPNEVTATGTGATSSDEVSDSADCETDLLNPAIDVTKSCTATAQIGDTISYTITVTNDGDEPLEDITVEDTLLGDLSASFVDTLAVGASDSEIVTYTVTAQSPDPVVNVVTATGSGVTSQDVVDDTATCTTDVLHVPGISVEKTCPVEVAAGEDVTFTITIENTGNEPLEDVVVTDALLGGDITAAFNLPDPLPVGGTEYSAQFVYTPAEGEDPVVNSVHVEGVGADSEVTAEDDATCSTDILNPAIAIVKLVNGEDEVTVPVGTTVTYTYEVTNTGDTTLSDVTVDDDILGHIGDIETLEPGQSVTLSKEFVVGEDPVTNVATAEGEDVLGRKVSASDDALVTPILGNPPPPTPFTGSDATVLGMIAMGLFGIGATLVAATRRRRARETA